MTKTDPSVAKKRILIVDDHALVREGMQRILEVEPDLKVAGTASSTSEALSLVESVNPDIVVSDLTLPDQSGLELIKNLRVLHPKLPVLVVSMHDENVYAERVLSAGGRGYLMKDSAVENIAAAIRTVLAGGVYVSPATTARFLETMTGNSEERYSLPLQRLSDREIEVFDLIGHGKNSHEIADQLRIATRTVDTHRRHIREKLRLSDSSAVLAYAIKWIESGKAL
jgi:DNA-binding NarL/FixJ family response regulator